MNLVICVMCTEEKILGTNGKTFPLTANAQVPCSKFGYKPVTLPYSCIPAEGLPTLLQLSCFNSGFAALRLLLIWQCSPGRCYQPSVQKPGDCLKKRKHRQPQVEAAAPSSVPAASLWVLYDIAAGDRCCFLFVATSPKNNWCVLEPKPHYCANITSFHYFNTDR